MTSRTIFGQTALLLAAGSLAAALLAGCSKEPFGEPGGGERVEIVPLAAFSSGIEATPQHSAGGGTQSVTKAPVDGTTDQLTLCFARADERSADVYDAYGAAELTAERAAGAGSQALNFSPAQYYLLNGLKSKMTGWYPQATSYDGSVVRWDFDGSQDIMTAPVQKGSITDAMGAFTFDHKLTQLQFLPYAADTEAQTAWGQVQSISVTDQKTTCIFTLASAETTGAVVFAGAADRILTVAGATAALPAVGSGSAVQFGQPLMIEPHPASYELKITIVTEKGGTVTTTVPARAYKAGEATEIRLKLTLSAIAATATIAEWADPVDQEMSSDYDFPVLCYGDATQNGRVTTSLQGMTTESYNGYVVGANGNAYASTAEVWAGEKGYVKLQVALSDEATNMNWETAYNACKNKTTDGGGWRLPRLSEGRLIKLNIASLTTIPGFSDFVEDQYYWTGTESTASDKAFQYRNGRSFKEIDSSKDDACPVRCVREVPMAAGDHLGMGVVFWVDPADASHYRVAAMNDAPSKYQLAQSTAYLTGDSGSGLSIVSLVKTYVANKPNGQSGVLATDYPAFGYCDALTEGGGAGTWFLPSVEELEALARQRAVVNFAFSANGGAALLPDIYWSSTENVGWRDGALGVSMLNGSRGGEYHKTNWRYVRCIREIGGSVAATNYPYVSEGKYVVSKDNWGSSGEPIHANWTGATPAHNENDAANALSAKFEVAGADCNKENALGVTQTSNRYTWADAQSACATYAQAGTSAGDWRLPTIKEVEAIYAKRGELSGIFTDYTYASTTEDSNNNNLVWGVFFFDGTTGSYTKVPTSNYYAVRCVRDVD